MAATGPGKRQGDRQEVETRPEEMSFCPSSLPGRPCPAPLLDQLGPGMQETLVYMRGCSQGHLSALEHAVQLNQATLHLQPIVPTIPLCNPSANREAPYRFRSPESVEMDEIMAAMVLTSLSSSSMVQKPLQTEPGPAEPSWSADMECGGGGGELSDSGSSGFWSWDPSSVSPAPSPSVTEMDSSPDEGLHMELEQGEELNTKKAKGCLSVSQGCVRAVYKCLWPACGKVLTSSVGIKRHIRMLHLGGSEQSQREEDFYYARVSSEMPESSQAPPLAPATPPQPTVAACGSLPAGELPIPPAPRPRSNSSCGAGGRGDSPLSRSAPSSFWQIHSEHLYQACGPVQLSMATRNPSSLGWTPAGPGHKTTPMVKPRCRSVSVGEQWLQQNSAPSRLQPVTASPSRSLCNFRKARGEAKKCRKLYGVERKDQWCTACRWKKACQRFPD